MSATNTLAANSFSRAQYITRVEITSSNPGTGKLGLNSRTSLLIDADETCPTGTTDVGNEVPLTSTLPYSMCTPAYMVHLQGRFVRPYLRACRLDMPVATGKTWSAGGFGDLTFSHDMVPATSLALYGNMYDILTSSTIIASRLTITVPPYDIESGIPAVRGIAIR